MIVALAAEIRQYLLHKRQSRHSLYTIVSDLYALISVQKASIKYYINNPYSTIPENIGGDYAQQPILSRISQIPAIDYSTFSKKDTIRLALGSFARKIAMIEQATRNLINLQIAHNQTQISFLESNDTQSKVSAASALMLNALYEEYNALNACHVFSFLLSASYLAAYTYPSPRFHEQLIRYLTISVGTYYSIKNICSQAFKLIMLRFLLFI